MKHEINMLNTPEFKRQANWLQMLTQLIEDNQDYKSSEAQAALLKWNAERDELRFVLFYVFLHFALKIKVSFYAYMGL